MKTLFQPSALGIVTLILLVSMLTLGWSYTKRNASKRAENTLRVGMMSGWAPFMSISPQGVYEGFDVDVAQELAKRMNKKLIIQDLGSLASCFVALEQGKIDLLLSGLDITQKRLKTLTMIRYTGENTTTFSLAFWKAIPAYIGSLKDFVNTQQIVAVESGSGQEAFIDQFPGITKKQLPSLVDIVLDIKFGKSTAALLEPRVASRIKRQNPEIELLSVPLPEGFQVYGCGIALKQNNTALATQVTAVIEQMQADGTLKKLEQRWQLEE